MSGSPSPAEALRAGRAALARGMWPDARSSFDEALDQEETPEFVDPPLLWGDADHVRELFEGTGIALEFEREVVDIPHDSVEDAVDCYATKFGPVVRARLLLEPEGRWPALHDDMAALFERHNTARDGSVVFPALYLMVLGRKRG